MENPSFPFKTALSEANVKIYRMGTTKWTYIWKICFSFRTSLKELIWCTNDLNVHIRIFRKRWSLILGCFFPVRILKLTRNRKANSLLKNIFISYRIFIKFVILAYHLLSVFKGIVWNEDPGSWDPGHWDKGLRTRNPWTWDPKTLGPGTKDPGHRTQDPESRNLRSWT